MKMNNTFRISTMADSHQMGQLSKFNLNQREISKALQHITYPIEVFSVVNHVYIHKLFRRLLLTLRAVSALVSLERLSISC